MSDPEAKRIKGLGPLSGPLGRRLLAGFLALSLVPLLVSNGVGYLRSEVIIEGLVERYLRGIADLQARHIGERLDRLEAALTTLSGQAPSVGSPAIGPVWDRTTLEAALEEHSDFDAVYVFDEEGEIVASAPLPPEDLPPWIGPSLNEPAEGLEVRRDSTSRGYPFIRFAVRIPTDDGDVGRRYLGATVSLGASLLDVPEHTAGSVETLVVDEVGRPVFVSHPHAPIDYGARLDTPLLGPASPPSAVYRDRVGTQVLGTVTEIPSVPWRLINEVPVADALQELRGLRAISLWLATVLAFLVAAAAWVLSARIVAPVRRLVAATRRLGGGELSARVETVERDEIGELGASFNRMAGELERASARVEELHRAELERAGQLATVGELAAGVAHEIKNPIAGISGGMDLIGRRVPDDPELRQIVEEMRRQTDRVSVAVRDLLSFARPVEPRLAPTAVNVVAERSKALIAPAAEGAGVSIVDQLSAALPAVHADEELLGQCVVNLLMNAIQAAGKGGWVRLATTAEEDGVTIAVTDSGEGVPPGMLEQIFKPFFTTKHQGTGLGLSITADIIARHEGRISVENEQGGGASFRIWLPSDPDGGPG